MDDWERFCDASYEEPPHYGIMPETGRTLTRERAIAILDAAAHAGLADQSKTAPGSTRRAVWECCYFQMCETRSRLIPSHVAETIINEFRAETESVVPQPPD